MVDPGREMQQAFEDGEWAMFARITSVYFGKEYYFRNRNGTVFSRLSHEDLASKDAAYNEFMNYIQAY